MSFKPPYTPPPEVYLYEHGAKVSMAYLLVQVTIVM